MKLSLFIIVVNAETVCLGTFDKLSGFFKSKITKNIRLDVNNHNLIFLKHDLDNKLHLQCAIQDRYFGQTDMNNCLRTSYIYICESHNSFFAIKKINIAEKQIRNKRRYIILLHFRLNYRIFAISPTQITFTFL